MSVYNNLLSPVKSGFSDQPNVLNDSFSVPSYSSSSSATTSTIASAQSASMLFPAAKDIEQQQGVLRDKIIKYLKTDCDSAERQRVIEYFEKIKGICLPLSVLWAYAKRMDEEPKNGSQNDDSAWFNLMKRTLVQWDEQTILDQPLKSEINRFISRINSIPPYSVSFLEDKLVDAKGEKLNCIINNEIIICNKAVLKTRLEKIIESKSLIFFGANEHAVTVYKSALTGEIVFYDSNSNGEILCHTMDELVDHLWEAVDRTNFLANLFGGFDPLDWSIKNFFIKSLRFKNDQSTAIKAGELKLKGHELRQIFSDIPLLSRFTVGRKVIGELINQIGDAEIIELLKTSDRTLRETIVRQLLPGLEQNTNALKSYIALNCQDVLTKLNPTAEQLQQLHDVAKQNLISFLSDRTEKALDAQQFENAKFITCDEALAILADHPGNKALAQLLLNKCQPQPSKHPFGLVLAIDANLKVKDLETAKSIIEIIGNRFHGGLSLDNILELENVEIAQFIEEKFGDQDVYCNRFGTCQLPITKINIERNIATKEKDAIMKQISDIYVGGQKKDKVRLLAQEAIKVAPFITLNDAALILAVCPGDRALAESLLKNCNPKLGKNTMMFFFAIDANLKVKDLETAKVIIEIVGNRFHGGLSLAQILELGNIEIAQFIKDKFGNLDIYRDL